LLYFAFFVKWVKIRELRYDKNTKFHPSAASAKTIRSIAGTFLVSTPNSK
jgi:hypothetical protein